MSASDPKQTFIVLAIAPKGNFTRQTTNHNPKLIIPYWETTMHSSRQIFTGAAARKLLASCTLLALAGSVSYAQQITGTPGSPSATTTIDGKYLPPPPPKFGGEINLEAAKSKPYWPPQVVPPQGAPNILLIMTDDQGYGVSGTFGGVIPTPSMDRIAKMGLRYTQFHSTAPAHPRERR